MWLTNDIVPGKVSFHILKDRAEVYECDVIVLQHPIRCLDMDGVYCILSGAHKPHMPILAGAELGCCQVKYLPIDVILCPAASQHICTRFYSEETHKSHLTFAEALLFSDRASKVLIRIPLL